MHVLMIKDEVAAIDLGLSDDHAYHSWIIAYNPKFHTLSPGIQLLEELITNSAALNYKIIDLGSELGGYKHHYVHAPIHVHSGFVANKGLPAMIAKTYGLTEDISQRILGEKIGPIPQKIRRRFTQIASCDASMSGRIKGILEAVRPHS